MQMARGEWLKGDPKVGHVSYTKVGTVSRAHQDPNSAEFEEEIRVQPSGNRAAGIRHYGRDSAQVTGVRKSQQNAHAFQSNPSLRGVAVTLVWNMDYYDRARPSFLRALFASGESGAERS